MNVNHCCQCEKTLNTIKKLNSVYTRDFDKYYQGTTAERMMHAGKRDVLSLLLKELTQSARQERIGRNDE